MNQKVAILDAGAQYGKVIDRRVRELGVETEILPIEINAEELTKYQALIISGGPESVYGANAPQYDSAIFDLEIPILGICYGMQLITHNQGGVVEKKDIREDGQHQIKVETNSALFSGLSEEQDVLLTHGDTVDRVGEGFRIIARSGDLIAGIEHTEKKMYGVQFHPEVDLTVNGTEIFSNFLFKIAKLEKIFTLENREEKAIEYIQKTVGDKKVLVLLSGGVDSTVCAALLSKALKPSQIYALHIDSGFMRKNESQKVVESLQELGLQISVINAQKTFSEATTIIKNAKTKPLCKTTNPEEKRKIIGDTFITVTQQAIADLNLNPNEVFLAQGTLRPDLIESASKIASGKADAIKTHHNDTALVRQLRDEGKIIEPLSDYHKDEVRQLGESLGLPKELVWRQPFPGPGLAIRIICQQEPYKTQEYANIEQKVQTFSSENISVHLLPTRTVGVQGDGRTYSYLVGLSGGIDASGAIDWGTLFSLAKEIPKHVHQVNRVAYILGEKTATVDDAITPTLLDIAVVDQLRAADAIVNEVLLKYSLTKSLTQVPVILFPIPFGKEGFRSVAIRTFITNDFMTGVPARPGREMPLQALNEMVNRILQEVPKISRVVYDLTAKPPGTTEWE